MEQNPYIFNLSEAIEYTKDGDFSKTASIELTGPTMPVFDLSSELSQLVIRAFMDAQDYSEKFNDQEKQKEDNQEIEPNAIKIILLSSKNVKFSDISKICRRLFIRVGTFDGKTQLNEAFFNKISIKDFSEMVCGYIANFIFPSLF